MSQNDTDRVYEEELYRCPKSGHLLNIGVDLGDEYLHDVCPGCRFKRKRRKDGRELTDEEQKSYTYGPDDYIVAGN